MGILKISSSISLCIILLTMEFAICCCEKNSSFDCIPRERKALLKFKASLLDFSNRLSSWDDYKDCCVWDGVKCDKTTGHVIGLDLRNSNTSSYEMFLQAQGNQLDSSLLELKYLSYLDLSYNDFQFSPIPSFLGSMKQLRYLNLSAANFNGIVPNDLGNLSNLRTLDLNFAGSLIVDDLMWVSNLSLLEHLDLSNVDLSRTKNLIKVMLPSLSVLSLSKSSLDNRHLSHACVNSTLFPYVQYLDLSLNSFDGEFPYFIQNMTSLRSLDLSNNGYNSSDPHRLTARNLVHLDLSHNLLHHKVNWIFELLRDKCHLKSLNLEHSHQFYGEISGVFKNLSGCWRNRNLETLILSSNKFDGNLPEELGELKRLNRLDLSYNAFSGSIPWSLGKLSFLTELDISSNMLSGSFPSPLGNMRSLSVLNLGSNQLHGEIPMSLGQLSNLKSIDISFNSFNSTFFEAHFAKLSKLKYLRATYNLLKFKVGLDWVPAFQLNYLLLGSCKIGGQFPQWLQTQKSLGYLDLSNCSISGSLPNWLRDISLSYLFLSRNHIEGTIPQLASSMTTLDLWSNMINHLPRKIGHMMPLLELFALSQNSINGSIPDSLCEMKALRNLDLSNNYFSGTIPDCWENSQDLLVMRLSSNELSGIIPNSIGGAYSLQWLRLNNNSLIGQLPSSLKNCTNLELIDVGENKLSGTLPEWIGNDLLDLNILRLRNNEFYGVIPSAFCQMSKLQIIDLGNNKLKGTIPHCFGNFLSMIKGQHSDVFRSFDDLQWLEEGVGEVIKGVDQEFTKTLIYVVNLDLSNNNLVGEIPSELTNLSALIGLNLSHNHLGGKIPTKIGDLKSLISLDLSNNILFGTIPDSLSDLSFLSHLNLSHNNLSGPIPTGNQLQTLEDPSIYDGNPELCGAPLHKKCHNDDAPNGETHVAVDEDDQAEKLYLYGVIISGFATGFWGLIGVLVFKRDWRQTYFRFIEVGDSMVDRDRWSRSPYHHWITH